MFRYSSTPHGHLFPYFIERPFLPAANRDLPGPGIRALCFATMMVGRVQERAGAIPEKYDGLLHATPVTAGVASSAFGFANRASTVPASVHARTS